MAHDTHTDTVESVGDFFRQVRETKGLSLDDVASKTRIHPDFLRALEDGNYAKLPDQVFAKGFVRSYARSLGLDEEDAMRRFSESAGAFYNKQSELEMLRVRQVADEKQRQANRKVVFAAAGVAVLALVLLLSREQSAVQTHRPAPDADQRSGAPQGSPRPETFQRQPATPRTSEPPPLRRVPESSPPLPPPAPPAEVKVQEPPTGNGAPAPSVTPNPQESSPLASSSGAPLAGLPVEGEPTSRHASLTLDLEALEVSWVVVQVDGGSPNEALLQPGERIRWKASDRFTVTLGNAGGVRVEFNGKQQGPFGPRGKVARDIVLKR